LFEVTPPESDNEAKQLSKKIKEWINQGKPKPEDKTPQITENEFDDLESKEDEEQKSDNEENKSKKKKGRFGFFRK
jgi:fused signal recognition particle receptor